MSPRRTARDTPAETPTRDRATTALLRAGAVAGPLFIAGIAAQALSREGFDARRHPLSMLSLGDAGWIQTANFILCGLLVLASAAGLRRALGPGTPASAWGPALIGVYGASLVWAGIFPTDPAEGFPPGTPDGAPVATTLAGTLHNFAPVGMGLALSVACFVFARRFARDRRRGWMIYSLIAPALYLVLGFAAFPAEDFRLMLIGGAAIWSWAAAVSLHFQTEPAQDTAATPERSLH